MNSMDVLKKIQEILKRDFEEVSIEFLEKSLFGKVLLNGISIEPAGETFKSVGIGGFSEKENETFSFNIHLLKKEDFEGDTLSLEEFVNDKDKIIEKIYCDELLGIDGYFRSFVIETEPLQFADDEVLQSVWIYKIKITGYVR